MQEDDRQVDPRVNEIDDHQERVVFQVAIVSNRLPQGERQLDRDEHRYGFASMHTGTELPLPRGLDSLIIETEDRIDRPHQLSHRLRNRPASRRIR
jgi:hypothetical protein